LNFLIFLSRSGHGSTIYRHRSSLLIIIFDFLEEEQCLSIYFFFFVLFV